MAIARRQLSALFDAGIRCFVSLMDEEPRGAAPYDALVAALAHERGASIACLRFPIEDHDVPEVEAMRRLEDALAERAVRGEPTYVHCWGGRGRTGLVAGVVLVRLGLATPAGFTRVIAELRDGLPGESPETAEQVAFVRRYTQAVPGPLWPAPRLAG